MNVSRRTVLAGAGAAWLGPTGLAAAGGSPLRIGLVEGVAIDQARLVRCCRRLTGRTASLVRVPSWASLRDHVSARDGRVIDAAILPCGGEDHDFAAAALPRSDSCAAFILSPGLEAGSPDRPVVLARALAHPGADARIVQAWADLGGPAARLTLLELPPAMLIGNVAAGLVDAALITGEAVMVGADGLRIVRLGAATARELSPDLALALARRDVRPGVDGATG